MESRPLRRAKGKGWWAGIAFRLVDTPIKCHIGLDEWESYSWRQKTLLMAYVAARETMESYEVYDQEVHKKPKQRGISAGRKVRRRPGGNRR